MFRCSAYRILLPRDSDLLWVGYLPHDKKTMMDNKRRPKLKPEYKELVIRIESSQYQALRNQHAETYAQHRLPFRVWLVNLILA